MLANFKGFYFLVQFLGFFRYTSKEFYEYIFLIIQDLRSKLTTQRGAKVSCLL